MDDAQQDATSDDSMPPLDYFGSSGAAPSTAATVQQTGATATESDDDMPPLVHVGSAPSKEAGSPKPHSNNVATETAKDGAESDSSMPPLEYVGAAARQASR